MLVLVSVLFVRRQSSVKRRRQKSFVRSQVGAKKDILRLSSQTHKLYINVAFIFAFDGCAWAPVDSPKKDKIEKGTRRSRGNYELIGLSLEIVVE